MAAAGAACFDLFEKPHRLLVQLLRVRGTCGRPRRPSSVMYQRPCCSYQPAGVHQRDGRQPHDLLVAGDVARDSVAFFVFGQTGRPPAGPQSVPWRASPPVCSTETPELADSSPIRPSVTSAISDFTPTRPRRCLRTGVARKRRGAGIRYSDQTGQTNKQRNSHRLPC